MSNEPKAKAARQQIIETAQCMLDGTLSFIEGARLINQLRWKAGLPDFDPDILPFVGIESETDALPIGDVRKLWAPDALEKLQPKIEQAEKWAHHFGYPSCQKLIDRLRLDDETTTLWRPLGPKELELIQQAEMRAFPPRLPDQPIFYPVLSEDYAIKIARDWNVPASGSGFVTRFKVKSSYLADYEVQEAGGRAHLEYWIPAEEMDAFNAAIVGEIEVVREFR
jgi:hypothetical protein